MKKAETDACDGTMGNHADVLVCRGDNAYIFYFTHPFFKNEDRSNKNFVMGEREHRTCIQAAMLETDGHTIICDRDKPFELDLSEIMSLFGGIIVNKNQYVQKNFNIYYRRCIRAFIDRAENDIRPYFQHIDEIAEINQYKVMKAFSDNRVSETHLLPTTGYGYDDLGRDTLDKVFAQAFEAEDALVRHTFVNGTHTITTALYAVLRPGDTLFAITGKPYDTLEEAIGISGTPGHGSLKDFGIESARQSSASNGLPDFDEIRKVLTSKKIRAVEIQRSKGYGWRPTYSAEYIGEIVKFVKDISPDTICIVDNCYGEFVDAHEPTYYGADLIAGSLIKNPGGGLALTGGYIAGRHDLIELCAYRLTCVGIGKECGASVGMNRSMY